MNKYNRSGFTIVELLIVIVVIGVLAAISIVAYGGIAQRSYAAKAASVIDGYVKIVNLYKVDNGTYPSFSDITGYACLAPAGSLPASSPFGVDECEYSYRDKISSELNTKLLQYASSLPDGRLPIVQYNSTHYSRGISYYGGSTAQFLYYINGDYPCPRGDKSSFRAGTTECSLVLN